MSAPNALYSLTSYSSDVTDQVLFPTSDFKRQLNLPSTGIEDDAWLYDAVSAGREYIERAIQGGYAVRLQTRILTLDKFPSTGDGRIYFAYPPFSELNATDFKYYDGNNQSTNLASTDYREFNPGNGQLAFIEPAVDKVWPATKDRYDAVQITFSCGSTCNVNVPYTIRQAIKLLVAHWYENREAVLIGTISKEIELGLQSLLQRNNYGYYG